MHRALPRLLLLLALLAGAVPPAVAATFRGTVTHVTDGDTLWVRPAAGGATIEIRLLDLDAPESCQRFGREARRALAQRVLNQPVAVQTAGQDDYQRTLARIRHRGEDVGGWLVREGYAWSSTFRGRPGRYEALEERARRERRGLWARANAEEPRSFRRSHGSCR